MKILLKKKKSIKFAYIISQREEGSYGGQTIVTSCSLMKQAQTLCLVKKMESKILELM